MFVHIYRGTLTDGTGCLLTAADPEGTPNISSSSPLRVEGTLQVKSWGMRPRGDHILYSTSFTRRQQQGKKKVEKEYQVKSSRGAIVKEMHISGYNIKVTHITYTYTSSSH